MAMPERLQISLYIAIILARYKTVTEI